MSTDALDKLSDMQVACLRLVADLKKTEQIAAELGVSPSTVNTHIERAIARLQVPNRREAARLVVARDRATLGAKAPTVTSNTNPLAPNPPLHDSIVAPVSSSAMPAAAVETARPEKQPTEDLPLSAPVVPAASIPSSTTAMGRRRNDLTVSQRLLLGLLALVLLCIGIAGLGAAIGQLSHWRASLAPRE